MNGLRLHLAVIGAAWLAVSPFAQDPPALVPINVAVTGADGTAIKDLTQEDFEVLSDDAPRPIHSFVSPPAPSDIVVLFDVSASLVAYADLREDLERSLVPVKHPGDRLRIGGIARRLTLSPQFSPNPNEIIAAARKVLAFRDDEKTGPSPIWDALDAGVTALESQNGRRAILIVSDGRATGNRIGGADAARHAIAANVVVQALVESRPMIIPQGGNTAVSVLPAAGLRRISLETGGLTLPEKPVPNGEDMPSPGPLLIRLMNDLHDMYTLGIAPFGEEGSFHGVTVRVKRPGLTVRTRLAFQTPARRPSLQPSR